MVKLDVGGEAAAASSSEVQTATSSTTNRSPNKPSSSHHRSPRSRSPQFRSESVTSPTSTCPTIASALWKPIWPPGWYPSSPSRSQTSSPSHRTVSTPDTNKRPHSSAAGAVVQIPTPPVITMSRPNDDPSSQQQRESTAGKGGVGDTTSTISTDEDRPKTPPDESEAMEAWLDEHPNFLHSYVVRKASRAIVDAWLQARTSHSGMGNSASAPVSGSTTPVRKISAHEFEKCSLFLPPMVSTTSDGTPTFLPVTPSEGGGSSQDVTSRPPRKSRQELRGW